MTNEMISFLMANGLSKQQATSSTAKICTQIFMKDDAKALIKEAQLQVEEARATVLEMRDKFKEYSDEMKTFQAVLEAQKEYGKIEDPKAKTAIALYCALLSVGAKFGASADRNIENAGYILYAFLGGQARREITNNPQTPKAWENAEVMESSTHEPRRYALGRL